MIRDSDPSIFTLKSLSLRVGFYQPYREAKIKSYKTENEYLNGTTMCAINLIFLISLLEYFRSFRLFIWSIAQSQLDISTDKFNLKVPNFFFTSKDLSYLDYAIACVFYLIIFCSTESHGIWII